MPLINRTAIGLVLGVFRDASGEPDLRLPNSLLFQCGPVEDTANGKVIRKGQVTFLYGPFEDTYANRRRSVYASILWDVEADNVLYTLLSHDHHPLRGMKRDEFLILTEFAPPINDALFWNLCRENVLDILEQLVLPALKELNK